MKKGNQMPRARRIYLENAVYYVALEGPSHEPIFRDHADYLKYADLLGKYKAEYRFKLFSYVFLPESIFLLIEPSEEYPVSQIMQKITPTYTKYYNAKYNRTGHLFQKRYHSVYVEKSVYLPRLTRYIHLLSNELQKETSFKEYPYSSYAALSKTNAVSGMVRIDEEANEVMTYLSDGNYERFMNSQTAEELEFLEKKLSRGAVLGTEQFEEEVRERIKEISQRKEAEVIQTTVAAVPHYAIRKTTLGLSGAFMATVLLSVYSVYLSFHFPTVNMSTTTVPDAVTVEAAKPVPIPMPAQKDDANLEGTLWDVELITTAPNGSGEQIKDKIRFTGKGFESYYFLNQGFNPSNYTVTVSKNGVVTWETMQMNEKGESLSWRGDWNGKQMEGVMSYHPEGKNPQDFSFMTNGVVQK
jgi:REP element-mobilizing transposase RayT